MLGALTRTKKFIFRTVRRLPYVGKRIDAEVEKQSHEMEEKFHETAKGHSYVQQLPATGMSEVRWLMRHVLLPFKVVFLCVLTVTLPVT